MKQNFFSSDTVFTVSNLTAILKDLLESNFANITLEGEISNYRPNASGHLYFTLKDETAQISAVMFRGRAAYLSFVPKNGDKVRCTGTISVYAPRGNYQIIITKMQLSGAGNILQILEERKRKLAAEGLFASERKISLPHFPRTIGIVTSPTGAAVRDVLQVTKRRNKSVNIVIFPALVQGEGAASEIAAQIKRANDFDLCDVLIVGRGGGSLEDLLPFSEEIVVRAVADSFIPVVSAVGHEIDWALCDYAADVRAPTPSAAAELVVPQASEIRSEILYFTDEIYDAMTAKIDRLKLMIKTFDPSNTEIKFRSIEQPLIVRLDNAKKSLLENMKSKIKDLRQKIENYRQSIENTSPQAVLSRGYSMVKIAGNGKIVRSADDVSQGTLIEIIPARGKIEAAVTKTTPQLAR